MQKLLLILNFACFAVQAQHFSELGRFSLPYSRGCAPVTVSITATDTFGTTARTYFYEEGLTETTDTFYTYTEPGIYKIVQFPAIDVSPKTDTLIFEVLPPTPPEFNIFKCSDSEVQVVITDDVYDYYVVKFTSSDSVIYTPTGVPPSFDYGQTSGNVQVAGYHHNAYPTCGDSFKSFTINSLVEARLMATSIIPGCQNAFFVSIEAETDAFSKYQVEFRQGSDPFMQIYEGAITQTSSSYPVVFTPDEPAYCVRINTLNPCTNEVIPGESICRTTDVASFDPLNRAYATYLNEKILIHINPTVGNEVLLSRRSGNSGNFASVVVINAPYSDTPPSLMRSFEYKLLHQDTCGNKVDSIILAAPYARLVDKNRHENTVTIATEDPINNLGGFERSVIIFDPDSTEVVEVPFDPVIPLAPGIGSVQQVCIRYLYDSGINIFSNVISTTYETTIFVPRAFTPNGDSLNDQLELFGLPGNEFEINIFNRWGERIHTTENMNPVWNGLINQEPAPEGTYRYRLDFKLPNGDVKTQVGTFVLIKK